MGKRLTRRDFLKLSGLLSALHFYQNSSGWAGSRAFQDGPPRPNVLILVLDTLSARHMSLYGYDRATTPNMARFAEQAVVYHNHHASANFTTPGTASMLTGTYPWTHRGIHPSGDSNEAFTTKNLFSLLPEDYFSVAYTHNSLAMVLLYQYRQALTDLMPFKALTLKETTFASRWLWEDYMFADWSETVISGVVNPPTSLFLSLLEPLRQRTPASLSGYLEQFPKGLPGGQGRFFLLEDVTDWLDLNLPALPQPHLAYFHLMPPHEPYRPRKDFIGLFDDGMAAVDKPDHFFADGTPAPLLDNLRRDYDSFIAYADAEFGRLMDGLARSGQLDNTYVVLTSDHGQLFERGIHGHITPVMYQPLLHVPLLVRAPGQTTRRDVHALTSAVDLLPTLLQLVGEQVPDWVEGEVLPGLGGTADPDRMVFALDAKDSSRWGPLTHGTAVAVDGRYKLIYYFGYEGFDEQYELFDLEADPEELNNLYTQMPQISGALREALLDRLKGRTTPDP